MSHRQDLQCKIYSYGALEDLMFVVICSCYKGKYLLSRHKKRDTWETQGGHIEPGETPMDAAKRELFEESGVEDADIYPVCDYLGYDDEGSANGAVFYADVHQLGALPESEMQEIGLFDTMPENLTYPNVTPRLMEKAKEVAAKTKGLSNMIIDTHAHYDDKAFDEDRAEVLASMAENNIHRIVNIGSSLGACKRTIQLMEQYDFIYGALGIHPTDSGELTEADIEWIKAQCSLEKCVAVGEIGLDYYWDEPERDIQKKWFVRQLQLAKEVNLPTVIHSRDAAQDTVDIMKAEHAEEIGGVVHCYSYSKELAKIFLNMGYFIGVGGVITFKNARVLKEVVDYVPLDRIVIETDSPYLAPVPYRGKRNDSRKLPHVLDQIAELKGLSREEVEEITFQNAFKLYKKLK